MSHYSFWSLLGVRRPNSNFSHITFIIFFRTFGWNIWFGPFYPIIIHILSYSAHVILFPNPEMFCRQSLGLFSFYSSQHYFYCSYFRPVLSCILIPHYWWNTKWIISLSCLLYFLCCRTCFVNWTGMGQKKFFYVSSHHIWMSTGQWRAKLQGKSELLTPHGKLLSGFLLRWTWPSYTSFSMKLWTACYFNYKMLQWSSFEYRTLHLACWACKHYPTTIYIFNLTITRYFSVKLPLTIASNVFERYIFFSVFVLWLSVTERMH